MKNLALALVLILTAAAVLLLSDLKNRHASSGRSPQSAGTTAPPRDIRLVMFNQTAFAEDSRRGMLDGLARAGLAPEVDFHVTEYNANGDTATLAGIAGTVAADRPDLVLAISTPVLQALLRISGREIPIVFTGVADGVRAGAGKSETDHNPLVTGITTQSPFAGMARLLHETLPGVRKVGTLFTPTEVNSELYRAALEKELGRYGIELVAIPVASSAETATAADELCSRDIGAVCQIVDNTTRPGFQLIGRKAAEKELPLFVFETSQMKGGAVLALARDYYQAGLEAADKAVRVLRGESPGAIPFGNTRSEALLLNPDAARRHRLRLSPELLKQARTYVPDTNGKPVQQ